MQTRSLLRTLPWRRASLCLLPALLAACGGGGSDGSSAAATQAISPNASDASCTASDFQAVAIARMNYHRARGAVCPVPNGGTPVTFPATTPLAWNGLLAQAAVGHSTDMQANNFHDHRSFDGRTLANRVDATGYAWSSIGENIAAGYASVNAVVDAWVGHEGHCQNVMNPGFTEVGMACVPGSAANEYGNYWTMDLARPL